MESSKEAGKYGGADALATIIAECEGITDVEAKKSIAKALASRRPWVRRRCGRIIADLGAALANIPPDRRREAMVAAARSVLDELAERDVRWKYPALRTSKMILIASWFYDRATIEGVFVQGASDYIIEYKRARAEGRWKAFCTKVRHWNAFWNAMGLGSVAAWIERLWKLFWFVMKGWWW